VIYTIYTIAPSEYLKGQLGATFELREPGGVVGDLEMSVASVPKFQPGQDALLFVWTDPRDHHQITAFEQGAVTIELDATTGVRRAARDIPLGSAHDRTTALLPTPTLARPPLSDLLDRVRTSIVRTSNASLAAVPRKD
jgi:hypothetical protein